MGKVFMIGLTIICSAIIFYLLFITVKILVSDEDACKGCTKCIDTEPGEDSPCKECPNNKNRKED